MKIKIMCIVLCGFSLVPFLSFAANGYHSTGTQSSNASGYYSSGSNKYDHIQQSQHHNFSLTVNKLELTPRFIAREHDGYFSMNTGGLYWKRVTAYSPIPRSAVIGGSEPSRILYVCRAGYQGGIHPGKVVDGKCNIGWEGREIALTNYEILISHIPLAWVGTSYGYTPPDAILAGQYFEMPFYICQANFNGGLHPGKLAGQTCNITWGGQEYGIPYYNVLIRTD